MRPRVYRTGLCALSEAEVLADRRWWPSLGGAAFTFEFRPHVPTNEEKAAAKTGTSRLRHLFRPPEVNILARTFEQANAAAQLLYAAHALIDSGLGARSLVGWAPYRAIPTDERELAEVTKRRPHEPLPQSIYLQMSGMVDVAGLAARISRNHRWQQAAYFHLASAYLLTVDWIDLHPGEREASWFQTPYLMHRVWEAQSLFAAYQAIEVLGLTIKGAGPTRPSIVAKKWDPRIRADLEVRLAKIGIAPSETISWAVRGRRKGHLPKLQDRTSESKRSPWASGDIKDEDILVVDAINRAHWLRSNVAAHRSGERLTKLAALDALNVQHLARLLVMNAVRFPWWGSRGR